MIKIPYGLSNYELMVRENYHFVDKTEYLRVMENLDTKYHFFLRPRRFGKSLWVSVMQYYYGVEYKHDFQRNFGQYAIGQQPTPLANQYLVLTFEFSRIDTATRESTYNGFLVNVQQGAFHFLRTYQDILNVEDPDIVRTIPTPEAVLKYILDQIKVNSKHKIYLLIDEYDHFANELLSFDTKGFKEMVSRNGFVRKFYETIKAATGQSIIERFFVTGVSPITLDSLTSGFNMGTHLTLNPKFNGLMGFTRSEVMTIIQGLEIPENEQDATMDLLKRYYNGYIFDRGMTAKERIYNSDMVLYFAREYKNDGHAPEDMMDFNIMSDYRKIRNIFTINNNENENVRILEELVETREIVGELVPIFNLEKDFSPNDVLSLLFYMGMVTIKDYKRPLTVFQMPNLVIAYLYYDYFLSIVQERAGLSIDLTKIQIALYEMSSEANLAPIMHIVAQTLQALSVRDMQRYYEATVKAIIYTHFNLSKMYLAKSEYESDKHFIDIALLRSPIAPNIEHEFLFEIKYLKATEKRKSAAAKREATAQLLDYCALPEFATKTNLHAYIIVVVGGDVFYKKVN